MDSRNPDQMSRFKFSTRQTSDNRKGGVMDGGEMINQKQMAGRHKAHGTHGTERRYASYPRQRVVQVVSHKNVSCDLGIQKLHPLFAGYRSSGDSCSTTAMLALGVGYVR